MRTLCQPVFFLSELPESAKEAARNWYREHGFDFAWYTTVYEDAASVADILGIDMRTRKVKYRDGTTRYDGISIGFSGFYSQGDGAHLEGRYRYAKNAAKAIREYAPQDAELHRIADELQALQRKNFYRLVADVKHSGRYSHEFCTNIDVTLNNDNCSSPSMEVEGKVVQLLRDFMRWIYRALKNEYEHQSSDEVVDEKLAEDGTEFTENGNRTIAIH